MSGAVAGGAGGNRFATAPILAVASRLSCSAPSAADATLSAAARPPRSRPIAMAAMRRSSENDPIVYYAAPGNILNLRPHR